MRLKLNFLFTLVAICLLFHGNVLAELKKIEVVGVYIAAVDESSANAEKKALKSAIRQAVEKAGVYVESYSKQKNFNLTADEVKVITGEIVSVEKTFRQTRKLDDGRTEYRITIEATVDTENISAQLQREKEKLQMLKERNLILQKDYEKLQGANEKLRNPADKMYNLYRQAMDSSADFGKRLDSTQRMIKINPTYRHGIAYALQAQIYNEQKDYARALECDLKYLEINRGKAQAYYFCALDYQNLKNWDEALRYIFLAIDYEPDNLTYRLAMKQIVEQSQK